MEDAFAAALGYLSRREYCRYELVEKLVAKDFEREIALEVVRKLAKQDLVSDVRFARDLIRVRSRRGYGPLRIESELRRRGVDQELISNNVELQNENWQQKIEQVVAKKYGNRVIESHKDWVKRANFLKSRGFGDDLVHDALGFYSE